MICYFPVSAAQVASAAIVNDNEIDVDVDEGALGSTNVVMVAWVAVVTIVLLAVMAASFRRWRVDYCARRHDDDDDDDQDVVDDAESQLGADNDAAVWSLEEPADVDLSDSKLELRTAAAL